MEDVTSENPAHAGAEKSILIVVKGNAPLAGQGLALAMALAMTLAKLKAEKIFENRIGAPAPKEAPPRLISEFKTNQKSALCSGS